MQDEFAGLCSVFVGDHLCGQWLSGHSESLCLEFDPYQKKQRARVVGRGEGVQQGVVSSEDCD